VADADPEPLTDEAAAAIVGVLHAHGVTFIVIGGFAIQLHRVEGLARTSDIDVTPERSRQNLERLAEALTELQARLRGDRLPDEGLPVPWHVDLLDRMDTALNLITRFGPLDLSLKPSGTDGYPDLVGSAVEFALAGTVVPTCLPRRHHPLEDGGRARQGQHGPACPPPAPPASYPVDVGRQQVEARRRRCEPTHSLPAAGNHLSAAGDKPTISDGQTRRAALCERP